MFIKVGVETIPPLTLAAGRLLLAAVLLAWYAAGSGYRLWGNYRLWGVFLFIGFFGNALPFTLIGWGELRIDSGLAAILIGIMPITTAVLAHLFTQDEPLRAGRLLGILTGFAGLIVLVGWNSIAGPRTEMLSQLAVLSGAISYAVTTVFARRHVHIPGRVLAAGATGAGALLITPLALIFERPWALAPSLHSAGALVMLAVFSTALATIVFFHLIKAVGATTFSQVNYLTPVMGLLWGIILLGERPGWYALIALALILAGIALVNRPAP
ncbi:MAG: EamA family transporter [Gammaproteobacteria bacterium]|nr:MAG: EamA family transporter [Gammaproteobacteria bacterium]